MKFTQSILGYTDRPHESALGANTIVAGSLPCLATALSPDWLAQTITHLPRHLQFTLPSAAGCSVFFQSALPYYVAMRTYPIALKQLNQITAVQDRNSNTIKFQAFLISTGCMLITSTTIALITGAALSQAIGLTILGIASVQVTKWIVQILNRMNPPQENEQKEEKSPEQPKVQIQPLTPEEIRRAVLPHFISLIKLREQLTQLSQRCKKNAQLKTEIADRMNRCEHFTKEHDLEQLQRDVNDINYIIESFNRSSLATREQLRKETQKQVQELLGTCESLDSKYKASKDHLQKNLIFIADLTQFVEEISTASYQRLHAISKELDNLKSQQEEIQQSFSIFEKKAQLTRELRHLTSEMKNAGIENQNVPQSIEAMIQNQEFEQARREIQQLKNTAIQTIEEKFEAPVAAIKSRSQKEIETRLLDDRIKAALQLNRHTTVSSAHQKMKQLNETRSFIEEHDALIKDVQLLKDYTTEQQQQTLLSLIEKRQWNVFRKHVLDIRNGIFIEWANEIAAQDALDDLSAPENVLDLTSFLFEFEELKRQVNETLIEKFAAPQKEAEENSSSDKELEESA